MRSKGKLRWDLVLIAALLLLSGILYLALNHGRQEGGQVVVRIDGAEVERHSLSVNGTFSLNGGSNILVIENGQAWLSDANCPDHICVKQGKIHYTGPEIISYQLFDR